MKMRHSRKMLRLRYTVADFWQRLFGRVRGAVLPVFLLFAHDVRTIFKNRATVFIIVGLCLLPSLYAWINIYACWDPYANTGNLPVAIVNRDQGTVFNGKVVNVGDGVIDALKENKNIGWAFVDEWQGNYGLNEGKYYALIEIPENFSERLTTLETATPQKPVITYRVNEKLNSIATKITDAAKNKLVDNIKTNFVKSVTQEALDTLNLQLKNSDLSVSSIGQVQDTLVQLNDDIGKLQKYISDANTDSQSFQKYVSDCSAELPLVNDEINSLQNIIEADKSLARATQKMISSVSGDLNTDVQQLTVLDSYNQQLISLLKAANNNQLQPDTIEVMKHCASLCASAHALLTTDAQNVRAINNDYNLSALSMTADTLDYMDKLVVSEQTALNAQIPLLQADTSAKSVNTALTALSGLSTEITGEIITLSNSVNTNAVPTLNNLITDFELELDDVGTIAEVSRALVPQLSALAVFSSASGRLSVAQANELSGNLTDIQDSLNTLIGKIKKVSDEDLSYVADLIQNHPDEIADFISSPIKVKEVDIYNTTTFGEGLTPFYTVLAIWIGALLCCALLAVNCRTDIVGGYELGLVQKHFGKLVLFLCISLIQSTIITLGDVFVLGVHPVDFPLMLGCSVLTSVTFTILIFTLVSLFGNVGKAIAVIMMVFQIAGAGGIYPIQTNPKIFGLLEPLWPFSYAINLFREAIAGPVQSAVVYNMRAMFVFMFVFLIAAVLKKRLHVWNEFFESVYEQAQI